MTLPQDPAIVVQSPGGSGTSTTDVVGPIEVEAISRGRLVLRRFLRRRTAVIGLIGLVALFLMAYLGPYLSAWPYDKIDFQSFQQPPSASHWFGTTQTGKDVFALTMRGMQKSLVIGLLAAAIGTGLAALFGAFGGYFGGWVDRVATTFGDLMLVLPAFLIIAILSPNFRGKSWFVFVILLGAFQWMITARVVRGLTLSLREREFVQAARFMGVPGWRVVLRHLLPNMSSFLIIDYTIGVGAVILAEVGLSFFGFGVQLPDVSMGTLIADGSGAALTYPWQFYFVAGLLVAIVLCVNAVGDGLRDALDPMSAAGRAS
jgi:peptide/nickel transport system permease protein